jgi:hypothetical protein
MVFRQMKQFRCACAWAPSFISTPLVRVKGYKEEEEEEEEASKMKKKQERTRADVVQSQVDHQCT